MKTTLYVIGPACGSSSLDPLYPRSRSWPGKSTGGFTLVEVAIAAGLVVFGLASIYAMQSQTLQIARAAHDSGTSSQILQQRVEQLRLNKFTDVASSSGLVDLMNSPTESEARRTGLANLTEKVTLTNSDGSSGFSVSRRDGNATATTNADFSAGTRVKAYMLVSWTDRTGAHRREFSTIFARGGVSHDGISHQPATSSPGGTTPPSSTPPPSTPPQNLGICTRHGRPRPHCGS